MQTLKDYSQGNFATRQNSAKVKLKLLMHGIRDNQPLFERWINAFKEEHYAYDNGNWGVDKKRFVPTEILLPGGIVSKLHIRSDSPLAIQEEDQTLCITENGVQLTQCRFLPRPRFWDFTTRNGTPTKNIAQMYGLNALNFNIFSGCQFHDIGHACAFCSVRSTVDKANPVKIHKDIEDLEDVCELATTHDEIRYLIMTGGSYLDREYEVEHNLRILRRIGSKLPWGGKIVGNVSFLPSTNKTSLRELYLLGVTNPSMNIEAWPRRTFEKICPGKAKHVGFERIIESLLYLVDQYGPGHVWSNFVAGIYPLADLKAGFLFMAERGIVPGANLYHAEVGSVLGRTPGIIDEEYILELYNYAAELYAKYGFQPYFDTGVLRNSLANEAFEGLL